ncbi:MAG: hypothetical protein ABSF29_05080 [Tepidisphaeraceae bacterium]|jgi:hypothetical protein
MSDTATATGVSKSASSMSAATALRLAWGCWVLFLVLPFFMFLHVVWTLNAEQPGAAAPGGHEYWFLAAIGYLLVAGPGSFFARSNIFKAYWSGQTVSPGKYFSGMLLIWLALEIGGLFSLAGCLVDRQLLPNLFPALVAFMFYVTFWPSGRAMVRQTGNLEDAALYEEPR